MRELFHGKSNSIRNPYQIVKNTPITRKKYIQGENIKKK